MPKFEYADEDRNLTFKWDGDSYIDVFQPGQWYPISSINVWDYEKEQPRIAITQEVFESECRRWLEAHPAAPPSPDANGNMTLGAWPPMRDND